MKVEPSKEAEGGLQAVVRLVLHETRTPLNAICGFTDLLLAGAAGPLNAAGLDYLAQVAAAARRLERGLGHLQEIAATGETDPAEPAEVDLTGGLADAGFALAGQPCGKVTGDAAAWRRLAEVASIYLQGGKAAPVELEARIEAGAGGALAVRLACQGAPPGEGEASLLALELVRRLARRAGGELRPTSGEQAVVLGFPAAGSRQSPNDAGQMAAPGCGSGAEG